MSVFRNLASQTAIYGASTMVGRFLNFLLVPLYLRFFMPADYGIVTNLYAVAAFLNVILTYGFETAFFRFSSKGESNVLGTALNSIAVTSLLFVGFSWLNTEGIAGLLKEAQHPEYIRYFILIVAMDSIAAVPFASLRQQGKSGRFAFVRLTNIATNIGFNLLFIVALPKLLTEPISILGISFSAEPDIAYIFISNLISSGITLLLLAPELKAINHGFNFQLWKKMMGYSLPLMLVGLAGVTNELIDRLLMIYLLPESEAKHQLGIYGASYKLSMILTMLIQAFRYASEPFFFAKAKENSKQLFADITHYFTLICMVIFLGMTLYLQYFEIFMGNNEAFFEGLEIVPILLLANLFLGIYINLSMWYKLSDNTLVGARISIVGAVVTVVMNLLLVPKIGYVGAAWTTLAVYLLMVVLNYLAGRKYYPIPYKVRAFFFYFIVMLAFYLLGTAIETQLSGTLSVILKTLLFLGFIALIVIIEKPKKILTSQQ